MGSRASDAVSLIKPFDRLGNQGDSDLIEQAALPLVALSEAMRDECRNLFA
jgi:hypothetical protein